jgi:hypothetical protein
MESHEWDIERRGIRSIYLYYLYTFRQSFLLAGGIFYHRYHLAHLLGYVADYPIWHAMGTTKTISLSYFASHSF